MKNHNKKTSISLDSLVRNSHATQKFTKTTKSTKTIKSNQSNNNKLNTSTKHIENTTA